MIARFLAAALTFMIALAAAAPAEARHVYVAYVDDNRPTEYAQADVLAAIQRGLREWEAHNSVTGLVLHWRGVIPLSSAAADFNNIVIRWLPENYTSVRGVSCRWETGCFDSPPTPANHIQLSTFFDDPVNQLRRANNPRWFWTMQPNEDFISVLHHELAHLLRNTGDHPSNSVLNAPAGHSSRYLWNGDILNVDNGRYPGHYQALQIFSVNGSNGNTSLKRDYLPSHRVLSPAAMSVGDGLANTGNFAIAYASTSLPGSSAGRGAIIFKRTDGVSNDFDRVYTANSGGVAIGTTYHRPCVAISASLQDYYLVWTSPVEDGNGARQIFAAESHGGDANSWTQPEVIPYAWTRSGVSCSIDRSSERLVVAYTGSSEEGIWITSRPSLTAGGGQWATPTQVPVLSGGFQPRNYGPPDISFDFFSTASGTLAWQESRDLRVHRTSVTFSGGTFVFGADQVESTDASLLRSWPVVSAEGVPVLGSSLFTLPSGAGYQDERRSLQPSTPFVSTDAYGVGPWYARRYTGSASNLLLNERVFLSTSNTGL
jgi:hypothetical protein